MFALCDQRSFYASCERVMRPDLRDKGVACLSNNDACIVALDKIAKAAGVKKFEPYFKQKQLIEEKGVHVFSSNYALYHRISESIMETLERLTPAIEKYSVDEAFCDLTGIPSEDLRLLAEQLRDTVWREQRIPMGVGIAPTKTLAKLGQYAAKEIPKLNGIAILEHPHQWEWLAKRTPINEVWGIGRRLNTRLNDLGVYSAYDLSRIDGEAARKLGTITLQNTVRELNGESCIPMELAPPPKQQIISSRSFGQKVRSLPDLLESLSAFSTRAAEKLRQQNCLAGTVSAFAVIKGEHGHRQSVSGSDLMIGGSDDARKISASAGRIIKTHFSKDMIFAKAGIMLADIRHKHLWQKDLLNEGHENHTLMPIMDTINKKYGRDTVFLSRLSGTKRFTMRREFLSPSYLTQWKDIPRIDCST